MGYGMMILSKGSGDMKHGKWLALLIVAAVLMRFPVEKLWNMAQPGLQELSRSNQVAQLSPARQQVKDYAEANGLDYEDYPESLIALLERNPETEKFVLEYPVYKQEAYTLDAYRDSEKVPLFLQWDQRWGYIQYGSDVMGITGCGPVCLAMAGFYLTEDDRFYPDRVAEFAEENGYYQTGQGSSWTLISEGGEKLGLDVTEIPLDRERVEANLQVDNPIICIMGPGDFTDSGHFIVLTGLEDGLIRVNDPNSISNSEKLWEWDTLAGQIRNLWVIRRR